MWPGLMTIISLNLVFIYLDFYNTYLILESAVVNSLKIQTYYKNWLIIEIPSYAGLKLFSVYRDRCPGTTEKLSIAKALRFLNNVLKGF